MICEGCGSINHQHESECPYFILSLDDPKVRQIALDVIDQEATQRLKELGWDK